MAVEKAVRAVLRGRGGLFNHVNQTGTRTKVKGAPTNKKQWKSGQNGTGMQHEIWWEREESPTRTIRKENVATTKTGKLSTLQCKASLVKLEKIQESHTLIKAL